LRAGAFSWGYGEWTEIGPVISEAAIGNIQAFPPQQGLVDHVVTPAIGLGWMIAEDAMDQYLVRYIERKTQNRVLRAAVRGGANPARSLANVLRQRGRGSPTRSRRNVATQKSIESGTRTQACVAPFEFAANAYGFVGSEAVAPVEEERQHSGSAVANSIDVNGCKMNALDKNITGDSLPFGGVLWTRPSPAGSHFQS
jgi:hypothetical protein